MRSSFYPLSVIAEAIGATAGWAAFILLTTLIGSWGGLWIGHRELPAALEPLLWSVATCLFYPPASISCAVMALAWCLPIRFDSRPFYITAAIGNLLTWLIVTALLTSFGCVFY